MRVRAIFTAFVALALLGGASATVSAKPKEAPAPAQFVLSPEGNHLWAYDASTRQSQLVVRAVNGDDPGATPTSPSRDINGQICVTPDQRHIITGEDTVLTEGSGGEGSHDPRIAGWGYFRIKGSTLGDISVREEGKLAPEGGQGPGYTGDPDNYGCGFLDRNRLVTTAIGHTLPGEPADGQLFIWFAPFDNQQTVTLDDGTSFVTGSVAHCQVDDTLATAGGIAVDNNGDVYVAANRPDDELNPGAVWKYSGAWPTSADQCVGGKVNGITKTLAIPPIVPAPHPRALTPSAVVISPQDTLYVSSVFTGTVSEFTKQGLWLRVIYPVSPVEAKREAEVPTLPLEPNALVFSFDHQVNVRAR